jgi:type VI secretion system secreted protein Hcp
MTLTGKNQGAIKGDCTMMGREDTILVYGFDHVVEIPRHSEDGLPTGKRRHGGVKVIKEVDPSSPMLYQALCTGERMSDVVIKKYRIDHTGQEEQFFTITLENAIVQKIEAQDLLSFSQEGKDSRHLEHVTFSYEKIIWKHESASIESEDSWQVPV